MAEFIQSEKDKPMLVIDGFVCVKDKQVRSKVYWKCQQLAKKCKGRAITVDGSTSSISSEHNHAGNPINFDVRKILGKVKTEPKLQESPHYIIANASSELSGCVAAALPKTNSIKRSIRRVRQEEPCGLAVVSHRRE